nr:DNA polymerase III subunit gamma/tau [Bacteroidaceae bacterium]
LPDNETFEVIADNPTLEEQLNKFVPRVEQHLRNRLSNSRIKMSIRLREETDKKKAFNKYEQYQLMLEQNPTLKKMKEAFMLELD